MDSRNDEAQYGNILGPFENHDCNGKENVLDVHLSINIKRLREAQRN